MCLNSIPLLSFYSIILYFDEKNSNDQYKQIHYMSTLIPKLVKRKVATKAQIKYLTKTEDRTNFVYDVIQFLF